MNKLIKLIFVNILGLFNINQIFIAREDGVKSNFETKTIITGLILLFYGFLLYNILIKISNNYLILGIGFFATSIICFIMNLTSIEPIIFRNDDNEMLFAMPVTRQQILFSKLFSIYLKNLIIVAIIMISTILAYTNKVGKISDTFGLVYLLHCFVIPFIPMILSSLIAYADDYWKTKHSSNITYKLLKTTILVVLAATILSIIYNTDFSNVEVGISNLTNIYLFTYLFTFSLETENIMAIIASIGIPFLFLYLYYEVISNNYLRICSLLKGVKKKIAFEYKKTNNMGKVLGVFKKDLLSLFQNKIYLTTNYLPLLALSFGLFFALKTIDFTAFENIRFFDLYFNTYLPPILAATVTFKCSTISSFSLEKENIKMLCTMPISLNKIIKGKCLVNIVIGTFFVITNGIMTLLFLKLDTIEKVLCFILPFTAVLFISFTSIILDLRFVEKSQTEDNVIIKQRLINLVPTCLSLFIGVLPIIFPLTDRYYFTLGSYVLAMIFAMIVEYIYLCVKKKSIVKNLLK